MINKIKTIRIAFLSTYPPRECGLATFTEDLVNEIDRIPFVRQSVMAIVNKKEHESADVQYTLEQYDREGYIRAAIWANENVDLLVIEHEYGIFGGECGEYIIDLAENLRIPFLVTTHTVLLEPLEKQRDIMQALGQMSKKVVVMAESSMPILTEKYGIEADKLVFIPHGVPRINVDSREVLKRRYGLKNKEVISSFGLLSPAKGLEYGIKAVAEVVPYYDNLIYLILGKTHPCVKESSGEQYRQSLMDLAENLGVSKNIRFVDKYLTKEEVITYLHLSDVYLTPYLSKEQAVSGTLAYAMGCGRVIVSTPYRYAKEMLSDGRGMLANFRDAGSIASCLKSIFGSAVRKKSMEKKTLAVGKTMDWGIVAYQYTELCRAIIEKNEQTTISNMLVLPMENPKHPMPSIDSGMKVG